MPPAYEILLLNTSIPQIQAAQAGDTYVVPRDIAVNADLSVTGNTTLGDASTDTVRVNGYMGVGGAGTSNAAVYLTSTALTGTSQYGFYSTPRASSSATAQASGFTALVRTENATFTLTNAYGVSVENVSKGASSTITNQHGVRIADQTQGTNNYGITSLVSSGANKWNIYASGTAANYFAGSVGIGTASPGRILDLGMSNSTSIIRMTANYNASVTGLEGRLSAPGANRYVMGLYGQVIDNASGYQSVAQILFFSEAASPTTTSSPGYLTFSTTPSGSVTPAERLRIDSTGALIAKPAAGTGAVFNEDGVDADFRVESDTNTHALFVQGSDGFVGVGASFPISTEIAQIRVDASGSAANTLRFVNAGTAVGSGNRTIYGAYTNGGAHANLGYMDVASSAATSGYIAFGTANVASLAERLRITSAGNLSIGGTADRATTVGTAALNIFNGTAPVGTLANGISIYSSSGEAYVMDAAGNATLFSPHDAETNEWIFKSKHTPTGKVLKIDVERLLRFVNDHFGLDAVKEFVEE